MSDWVSKVEYICDKFEAVIDVSWFLDLCEDDCPAYDPDLVYRAFWSPIEGDSPSAMLERVPQIPVLTEDQQKAAQPGYYQVVILGIEDDSSKFELTRTRRSVNRGRNTDTRGKQRTTKNGSREKASEKSQSKSADKAKATQKNLAGSLTRDSHVFKDFDRESVLENGEFDSDDSTKDPTLISDNHVKVLKSSLRNLKKKLLEKCKENEELEKRLQERDAELTKLRELNRGLQENVLQRMATMLNSATSSRSSSLSSLNLPRSLPTSPLCSRSRSVSTSSSCSGIHSRGPSPLSQRPSDSPQPKRKTPPDTPKTSGFKRALHNTSDGTTEPRFEKDSPNQDSISGGGSFDDSTSNTIVLNESTNTSIPEATDDDLLNATEGMDTTETGDTEAEENESLVHFCEGFKVDQSKLKIIESRALGKVNDSTYVKELAVAVFGLKVLYNSSLSERKYSRNNEHHENQKPRKKLDETALSEIADRLKKRVVREFNGAVPEEAFTRYKSSTVNRYIYDKIKRMRQTENYRSLEDKY